MSKPQKLHASNDLAVKSVIVYDNLAFFANASSRLGRIGSQPKVAARWTIEGYPIDNLEQKATAEKSLIETADAHLIVIPAQHADAFPFHLREWLEQWAAHRQIPDAALAVIGDGTHADLPRTVSPELTRLAQKHGLNLIVDKVPAAGNEASRIEFPQEILTRELTRGLRSGGMADKIIV
jgi:hypothetical protein